MTAIIIHTNRFVRLPQRKVDATTLAGGQVSSVTTGKNGVTLNVNGIGQVTLADVKQVM